MVAQLAQRLSKVEERVVDIGDIRPKWMEQRLKTGIVRRRISTLEVGNDEYRVTDRFLQSLASRFHVGPEFFRYFAPDEVFDRVQAVHPYTRVRLVTDGDSVLGLSNPARAIVRPDEVCRLLENQQDRLVETTYAQGVVKSVHRMDEPQWEIGHEAFTNTFTLETPVDGFGLPSVYLSLIRLICTNGLVGYAPAFRTDIPLGRNTDPAAGPLGRAMECFSNEEGYAALRQRLESARRSEASIYEVRMLCRALERDTDLAVGAKEAMQPVHDALWKLTGDIAVKYGVASDQAISRKKQSALPMDCTVFDLLTFATEIATHHADKLVSGRQIHAWVGQMLSREYDLEESIGRGEAEETPAYFLR